MILMNQAQQELLQSYKQVKTVKCGFQFVLKSGKC